MSDAVMVAIIAACVTIVGTLSPVITVWLTNRARAQEREVDYARQDERADRVEAVAEQAREAARLLLNDTNKVAGEMTKQSEAIEHVRVLVNSDKTVMVQDLHDARTAQLATLRELVKLRGTNGTRPSPAQLAAIGALEQRVAELAAELADRARQLALVDSSAADRTIKGATH